MNLGEGEKETYIACICIRTLISLSMKRSSERDCESCEIWRKIGEVGVCVCVWAFICADEFAIARR